MKLNYKNQLILSCGIIILFNLLNTLFKHWIFTSIAYFLCGLLWILHPVMPASAVVTKRNLNIVRLGGVFFIFVAIFTRSYLY